MYNSKTEMGESKAGGLIMDSTNIVSFVKTTTQKKETIGTGFFTKKTGQLITCYHVLNKIGCYNIGEKIGYMFEGDTVVNSAELIAYDDKLDIAILDAKTIRSEGYSLSIFKNEGDSFDTLGFPEGSLQGLVAHPNFERLSPNKLIELNNANKICKGFSGAPLINQNGKVIGVIKSVPTTTREKGSCLDTVLAIPIEELIKAFPALISIEEQVAIKPRLDTKHISREPFVDIQTKSSSETNKIKHKTLCPKEDIFNIAKMTFKDMVQIWLDKSDAMVQPGYQSNMNEVDFIINLPSMQPNKETIQTLWVIESSLRKEEKHTNIELDTECFHLVFSTERILQLKEILNHNKHIFLAFAHNSTESKFSELCQIAPQERFEWYCIDLNQSLFEQTQDNFILVPCCNILNLSTFSLLWSSLWVKSFYSSLYTSSVIEIPNLMDMVRLTHPYRNESIKPLDDWSVINKKLLSFEREFGKNEFSNFSLPLGIGYALEVIKTKLYASSSKLDTIQNYCPESLYGNMNLWLFSRSYHGFMTVSGQVLNINSTNNNFRILPLPDDPDNISALVKVCLWHIVLLYSSLNVEVRIIYRPSIDAGVDHSYYGGGIGYFPWLSLSDDGVTWMIEQGVDSTNGQHRDFINEHMNDLYIEPYHSNILEIAHTLKLHTKDLSTATKCPIKLFPKQDRFIEYPFLIFGNNGFRSINSLKLKL